MVRVTVTHPGIFVFDGDGVFLAGWGFSIDGDHPKTDDEEKQLMKATMLAVIDYMGGCLEMTGVKPPSPEHDAEVQRMAQDLINRAKS
jgi:hypothetical protein